GLPSAPLEQPASPPLAERPASPPPPDLLAPAAPPPAPSPALVVPSKASSWWPPSTTVKWAAGGIGAILLVVLVIAVATGGDEPTPTTPEDAAAAREGAEAPGKDGDAPAKDDGDGDDDDGEETPEAGDEPPPPREDTSDRTMQASLASVDDLIERRQFEAAKITLGHLLEAQPEEAALHWRMARVLTALGGNDNREAALGSHASAIAADEGLLDDDSFMGDLRALMDDPKLRSSAVVLAIEHLGARVDDQLLGWLNVQKDPLDYELRHRMITHLQEHERGGQINRPLQRALDLWQAGKADDPCGAFGRALDEASREPDSFLLGTLRAVAPPTLEAPDAESQACPGAADRLQQVQGEYDAMFAGIEPIVPRAFRKRRAPKRGR
ncbi:MAG: hypothetical protein KDK70_03420, partial [Myxococcales bacterium]|nr:hypothetical protein [Myxococcales bacterium]